MNTQHHKKYPPALRNAAFDLFVSGLSQTDIAAELQQLYGAAAPALATLKRWSRQDSWTERRQRIRRRLQVRTDDERVLTGDPYMESLQQLRGNAVQAVGDIPFRSAEGALYALAALERVIERERRRRSQEAFDQLWQGMSEFEQLHGKNRPLK